MKISSIFCTSFVVLTLASTAALAGNAIVKSINPPLTGNSTHAMTTGNASGSTNATVQAPACASTDGSATGGAGSGRWKPLKGQSSENGSLAYRTSSPGHHCSDGNNSMTGPSTPPH